MTEFISRKYGNEGYEIIIKTDIHEHYRATEDFARRLIDHAKPVTIQRWIPVSERLPEQGQEVIVYDGGVLKPKVFCYLFWNKDYNSWARITHWMPLPEPLKGE